MSEVDLQLDPRPDERRVILTCRSPLSPPWYRSSSTPLTFRHLNAPSPLPQAPLPLHMPPLLPQRPHFTPAAARGTGSSSPASRSLHSLFPSSLRAGPIVTAASTGRPPPGQYRRCPTVVFHRRRGSRGGLADVFTLLHS